MPSLLPPLLSLRSIIVLDLFYYTTAFNRTVFTHKSMSLQKHVTSIKTTNICTRVAGFISPWSLDQYTGCKVP